MSPDEISLLRLLQLADSALPVGGSAQSYGLETLAQDGSLTPENLEDFLREYLEESGALDAAFVRGAWRGAGFSLGVPSGQGLRRQRSQAKACAIILPNPTARNVETLDPALTGGAAQAEACATILPAPTARNVETPEPGLKPRLQAEACSTPDLPALSAEYGARKLARESREASLKLGRRLAGLVNDVFSAPVFEPGLHYCIVFGAAGALFGASQDATALGFLHQSVAGLISACQRLMPLGQSAAARILWNLKPAMVNAARCEEVWCFSPYPELASMRHGSLGTRLFIS